MLQHFTRAEAAKLLGATERRLRYWSEIGLIEPSIREKGRVYYDFQDLICLKTALGLIEKGLPAHKIKKAIAALTERIPEFDGQLHSKRIYVFGNRVIISHKSRLIDTHSGQLLLKFDVDSFSVELSDSMDRFETGKTAEEWFREGLRYDSTPDTYDLALHAYEEAVKLNPVLANAYVNMGRIFYNQKKFVEAQRSFRLALQRDPYHAKASFNLGNVLDELNCTEEAIQWYERAVEADPKFPDVYYNLAAASEKLGLLDKAIRHWKAYLKLDSTSRHAQFARRRIHLLESELAKS